MTRLSSAYALGIDLGTTFTAAAVWRDGRAEISSLGNRSAAIPSVVLLREDSTIITGESADRRASTAPNRVAREFKRRLGDPTPILLGGVPYSAESLMGRLLRAVVDEVSAREGGPPASVCVCHPANWGPYKTDLLQQAVRSADLENASFTTEPEAAAVFYAGQQRMADGAVVAVYDLGGGTFDAAVLRKTTDGFEIIGRPEGIERLGGLDFDAAVYAHVSDALGGALLELDEEDPATVTAVARLKEECIEAKEALSSDTDTTIPVLLPNLTTEVRLTRAELEDMVRPALEDSIGALRRALRSAGITPEQLDSVLLVGGSSRIPVVAQLVATELGRPVAVDAHPKHAVALGAARLAGAMPSVVPSTPEYLVKPVPQPISEPATKPMPAVGQPTEPRPAAGRRTPEVSPAVRKRTPAADKQTPAAGKQTPELSPAVRKRTPELRSPVGKPTPTVDEPTPEIRTPVGKPTPAVREPTPDPVPTTPRPPRETVFAEPATALFPAPPGARDTPRSQRQRKGPLLSRAQAIAATVVLVGLGAAGFAALTRDHSPASAGQGGPTAASGDSSTSCTSAIKANPRWVCLTEASLADGTLTIKYDADFGGDTPSIQDGYHLNIYGGDGVNPPDSIEGRQSLNPGQWYEEDQNPSVLKASSKEYQKAIGNASKVCARIATKDGVLVKDGEGNFATGNCISIKRS